jgi:outer membrane protein assembly factor BamC
MSRAYRWLLRGVPALAVMVAAIGSTGCSSLSGSRDFSRAGRLPPLEVPPDLARPQADTRFNLPEGAAGSATFSEFDRQRQTKAKPGETGLLPIVEQARIERAGSERWLVLPGPPEKVWPVVRDFWVEAGFVIATELPEAGVMETDWAETRPRVSEGGIRGLFDRILASARSSGIRDRFRARLERSADGKTTEVYVSHRGLEEVQAGTNTDRFIWQSRPSDPELEAEMLRRIMVRFGAPEAVAKAAVAKPAAALARLEKAADGTPALLVLDEFDRAWRRVGLSLDRLGFAVEDRDRSKGLYFVRYADADADRKGSGGVISRLAFWRDGSAAPLKAQQFRLALVAGGEGTRVRVLGVDGSIDRSETAQRILGLLHEQLR